MGILPGGAVGLQNITRVGLQTSPHCVSITMGSHKRGALIVLEGLDRVGKTTQCEKLVSALRQSGRRAETMRFPNRTTPIGQMIGSYLEKKSDLEDHAVHLLFSANRWEQAPLIKQKLERGITLILDRYAFSGVAFTSAKRGICLNWCMKPDVGLPKPDLVMFLELNPTEAALRGQFGTERYETSDYQILVLQRFQCLMRKDPSLNWQVIDASLAVDDVHNNIVRHSLAASTTAECGPLGVLWADCSLET